MADRLYSGYDLPAAAAKSDAASPVNGRLAGIRNALGVLADTARRRFERKDSGPLRIVTAAGRMPDAAGPLTIGYAGFGQSEEWCLSSALGPDRDNVVEEHGSSADIRLRLEELLEASNIVFLDGLRPPRSIGRRMAFLQMPAWIKQRLGVSADWSAQVASLRRGTRQEATRMLRKYGYESRLTRELRDFEHFYHTLYMPYLRKRFGSGAVAVDLDRFLSECRRGAVLQLVRDDTVVGAALLRRIGNTMAIIWSALHPEMQLSSARGATDTMDYFSLLYAHLKGCRWLDFGPSRPDLEDGLLRYKSKWGAMITPGLIPQSQIWLGCTGKSAVEHEFLRRHAFLTRTGRELTATVFLDGTAAANVRSTLDRLHTPGIHAYRVILLPSGEDSLRPGLAGFARQVTVYKASSVRKGRRPVTGHSRPVPGRNRNWTG